MNEQKNLEAEAVDDGILTAELPEAAVAEQRQAAEARTGVAAGAVEDVEDVTGAAGEGTAPPPAPNVMASVLMLMLQSRRHRHQFVSDIEWSVLPPLALQQFRLFQTEKGPIGYVTWAFLSEETAKDLPARQGRLKPTDWRSGDQCWLIDLVAPMGGQAQMIQQLKADVLKDRVIHLTRFDPETGERVVEIV